MRIIHDSAKTDDRKDRLFYFVATSTLNHSNPFTGLTSVFLNPASLQSFAH
jgi:hypothetical protein